MKQKYATTDMRKQQNRMSFGVAEEETMDGKGLDILFLFSFISFFLFYISFKFIIIIYLSSQ